MPIRPTKKRRSKRRHNTEDEDLLDLHIPSSMDMGVAQTMTSIAQMERCIARILLLRYQQDIARLFSTRIHNIALVYIPKLIHNCVALSGPAWVANNADSEDLRDFFRSALAMDLRQSGERIATKSVLWSYTAIRHFVSNLAPATPQR
jgi:RNA polymerase II-associated protein 3